MPKVGAYVYPMYTIDSALGRLRRVYEVIREEEIDRSLAAETLGMAEKGGGFANLVSSMEILGLVETGKGKLVITELAKLAMFGDDAERGSAKTEAVMSVDLFKEIFQQYGKEATEEQVMAFLRQKANVDVIQARKKASKVTNIYKKMSNHITSVGPPEQAPKREPIGVDRREMPELTTQVQSLKIQYGDVFIQVPANDLKAIALAKQALEFMESVVRKKQEEDKK